MLHRYGMHSRIHLPTFPLIPLRVGEHGLEPMRLAFRSLAEALQRVSRLFFAPHDWLPPRRLFLLLPVFFARIASFRVLLGQIVPSCSSINCIPRHLSCFLIKKLIGLLGQTSMPSSESFNLGMYASRDTSAKLAPRLGTALHYCTR